MSHSALEYDDLYIDLEFPVAAITRTHRGDMYQRAPFCKAFSKMQNAYDFGASYDINPINPDKSSQSHIKVSIKLAATPKETAQRIALVMRQTNALLRRWTAKGAIKL